MLQRSFKSTCALCGASTNAVVPLTTPLRTGTWPLTGVERQALARMRGPLASIAGSDIDDAVALIDALLEHGVTIEQERY